MTHRGPVSPSAAVVLAGLLLLTSCGANDTSDSDAEPEGGGTIPGPALESAEATPQDTDSEDDAGADTGDEEPAESAEEEGEGVDDAENAAPEWPASNTTSMEQIDTISDPVISPKSIVASGHGLAIANNMMYQNTVTVYDTEAREAVQNLSDSISPADFGVEGYPETVVGAPVEAVWTEDGQYAYVSQYRLADMGATAEDLCQAGEAIAPSAVYRYSVQEQDWDQFIEVGRVPKYVELTPDGNQLLVSNWCDHDLSVVDVETAEETMRIPLNSQPRGIAVMPDNRTAYVTAMFAHEVYKVDLETGDSEIILNTGQRPRHLLLDPAAENLYITVAGANQLLKVDPDTDEVIDSVATGLEPRTMHISSDGTALYVVNYDEDTVSKYDAQTLEELIRLPTGGDPIGVNYDQMTGTVWVANYHGSISVYDDTVQP